MQLNGSQKLRFLSNRVCKVKIAITTSEITLIPRQYYEQLLLLHRDYFAIILQFTY